MKYRIGICGHFGGNTLFLDGQTVKTKIIYSELERVYGGRDILPIDTCGGIKKMYQLIVAIHRIHKDCDNVIILPAQRGLMLLAPLLSFLNLFTRKSLHYIVIGGWLPSFINRHHILDACLKGFDGIYVETQKMCNDLKLKGFKNAVVLPNCKELSIVSTGKISSSCETPYKLCTFSRVMKEKGIEEAIDAVKSVNNARGKITFTLDIYGQINTDQADWFRCLSESFPCYIKYGGLIPYEESTCVLKEYQALLFPTFYDGEGLAGTIIDAMAAGVPVIASDWKYNAEVIKDGYNGRLFATHDIPAIVNILFSIADSYDKWREMKKNCVSEAEKYLPGIALHELFARIK